MPHVADVGSGTDRSNAAHAERSRTPRTRRRTPAQIQRQGQVFELHLEGKTHRQIAAELTISLETVVSDIRFEAALRAEENAADREQQQAVQLARCDALYADARKHFGTPGSSALPTAAKVLEMRSKILGLDAPTKVDGTIKVLEDALAPPAD